MRSSNNFWINVPEIVLYWITKFLRSSCKLRFVGRSQLQMRSALTVEERRWVRATVHTSWAGRGWGASSWQTLRHPPSRMNRSRPHSARNICGETGWSGSHSIIHLFLAHTKENIIVSSVGIPVSVNIELVMYSNRHWIVVYFIPNLY